jgi:hypothetical protein
MTQPTKSSPMRSAEEWVDQYDSVNLQHLNRVELGDIFRAIQKNAIASCNAEQIRNETLNEVINKMINKITYRHDLWK